MEISGGVFPEAWFMQDIVFVLLTVGFFVVALGYVRGCDRLK
ncbi:MAG: hypothetical protein ABSC10_01750 [Candidatus Acidiferrales bacterium]|jgi:hypothetical protein